MTNKTLRVLIICWAVHGHSYCLMSISLSLFVDILVLCRVHGRCADCAPHLHVQAIQAIAVGTIPFEKFQQKHIIFLVCPETMNHFQEQ